MPVVWKVIFEFFMGTRNVDFTLGMSDQVTNSGRGDTEWKGGQWTIGKWTAIIQDVKGRSNIFGED